MDTLILLGVGIMIPITGTITGSVVHNLNDPFEEFVVSALGALIILQLRKIVVEFKNIK